MLHAINANPTKAEKKTSAPEHYPDDMKDLYRDKKKWEFLKTLNLRVNQRLHQPISVTDHGLTVVSFAPETYDEMLQQLALIHGVVSWPDEFKVLHPMSDSSGSEFDDAIDD